MDEESTPNKNKENNKGHMCQTLSTFLCLIFLFIQITIDITSVLDGIWDLFNQFFACSPFFYWKNWNKISHLLLRQIATQHSELPRVYSHTTLRLSLFCLVSFRKWSDPFSSMSRFAQVEFSIILDRLKTSLLGDLRFSILGICQHRLTLTKELEQVVWINLNIFFLLAEWMKKHASIFFIKAEIQLHTDFFLSFALLVVSRLIKY